MRVPREVMAILNATRKSGPDGLAIDTWGDYQAAKAAERLGYVRVVEAPAGAGDDAVDHVFLTDHGIRIVLGPVKAAEHFAARKVAS